MIILSSALLYGLNIKDGDVIVMYNYRQKCLYDFLKKSKTCSKLRLAKIFFCSRYENEINDKIKFYGFIPYRFGPFSFELFNDLERLEEGKFISIGDNNIKFLGGNITVPDHISMKMEEIVNRFSQMNEQQLIDYVYDKYPEYTIFSEIKKMQDYSFDRTGVYSLGYEGLSIDEFLMKLIREKIQCLIDVRNNPWSMKYGFTKHSLQTFCDKVGIEYIGMPSLGISSDLRQNLENKKDYDRLFVSYSKNLVKKSEELDYLNQLSQKKRIALMCFEKDPNYCHRRILAETLGQLGAKVEIS